MIEAARRSESAGPPPANGTAARRRKTLSRAAATVGWVALLGLLGGLLGTGAGVLAGAAWVWVMHTTSFEGYSGMLVFFGFAPAGALLGALGAPVIFLLVRRRA